MRIGIGTGRFINISILLTCDITFIFYDDIAIDRELPISTLNNVIAATNTDVEVAANDAPLVSTRSRRSESVDESTTGPASD
jgi:hypothetical protein